MFPSPPTTKQDQSTHCNEKLRYRSRGSCVLDFTMWLFCYPFLTIPFLVNFYTFKKSDVHSLFRQVDPRVIQFLVKLPPTQNSE